MDVDLSEAVRSQGSATSRPDRRQRRRLIHYSTKPLAAVHSVPQRAAIDDRMLGDKPDGLWVSATGKDDWKSWCKAEQFALHALVSATEIVLKPTARLLWVVGERALDAFDEEYGIDARISPTYSRHCIDWPSVARLYQGIVISPYVWSRRLDGPARWYYGWDCASGCIWDADAIQALLPVADGALGRQDGSQSRNGTNPDPGAK